jgi:hypothetical protein
MNVLELSNVACCYAPQQPHKCGTSLEVIPTDCGEEWIKCLSIAWCYRQ